MYAWCGSGARASDSLPIADYTRSLTLRLPHQRTCLAGIIPNAPRTHSLITGISAEKIHDFRFLRLLCVSNQARFVAETNPFSQNPWLLEQRNLSLEQGTPHLVETVWNLFDLFRGRACGISPFPHIPYRRGF